MIRKLSENDNSSVMEFLKSEAEINHYLISDIEEFGYNESFQEVYGEFNNNKLNCILLKCFGFVMVYAKGNFDIKGITEVIESFGNFYMLVGKEEVVSKFEKNYSKFSSSRKKLLQYLKKH